MIHQLLNLTRPLYILDTETTGTDPKTDRIVELGFQRWTAAGMDLEWRSLVNPGVPISASATKVHGITDEMVRGRRGSHSEEDWPSFANLAKNLARGFTDCDFAGANVRFDLRIIASEMQRAGVDWNYADARIVDAQRLEQLAVPRDLSALHAKYTGKPHDGAHGALSDVRASATVIVKQLEAHLEVLPRDLDALHALQWPGWLCDDGSFKMIDGVATCQFGKHRGKAMRDIPVDYFDWILNSDFPADVKALAQEAKLGRFPDGD